MGWCALFKEGLFWRVGNGEATKIWGDKWIHNPTTFSIQTPCSSLDPEEKVSGLTDRDTHWWKTDLSKAIFHPHEAKEIQSIPFSSTNQWDVMVWSATTKGIFTIKSAYHMAKTLEMHVQAESSNSTGPSF